jgi:predicted RNA-binding protein YlxR (DUF448 family)
VGAGSDHTPIRTCISCNRKRAKRDLIRLAVDSRGCLVRDDLGRIGGRGAYICNREACYKQLTKMKHLRRAFKGASIDSIDVHADLGAVEGQQGI